MLWLPCPDFPFAGPLPFPCCPAASYPTLPEQGLYSQPTLLYLLWPLGKGFEGIRLIERSSLYFRCGDGKICGMHTWKKWKIRGKICGKSKITSIWNIGNSPVISQPRQTILDFACYPLFPTRHARLAPIFGIALHMDFILCRFHPTLYLTVSLSL